MIGIGLKNTSPMLPYLLSSHYTIFDLILPISFICCTYTERKRVTITKTITGQSNFFHDLLWQKLVCNIQRDCRAKDV